MGRKRVHNEETAEALLDAAERILEAEGLEALTVRRVADEVGTTTRAVYSSLGSKDALIAGLGVRGFALLAAKVAALPRTDDPVADLIAGCVSGFRAWALAHPALFQVTFQQRAIANPEVRERFEPARREALEVLLALIRRLQDSGHIGGRTVLEATWQVSSLCEGLAAQDLRMATWGGGPDSTPIWTDALSTLIAGWQATRHGTPSA
ncbi:TetR/AcrR family transcriptional regulator [Streptomyces sp. SKN60]|uniref:TetR/AcrR family transcriptional regulator n=1 Tax=Streptomyces sp. SKN60 TaxID=2855506 RepID=UPI0022479E4F|nr:TetR/AcrR family transcriptional regulator [Streptomyces sp. SKN60]MCX2180023.1 TetR/AcrR family transcriptional regulator [Streptomyces sp. SKN60]